jgi:tyrosyl-tRNA synthetase
MDKIEELLTRGVVDVFPSKKALLDVLRSDKKIKIYIGADPTAPQLHLGHSTNFLILRKLQDLGHKIIILIGDFTGMIGDPTDRSAARRQLTRNEVVENAKTYKQQLEKLLRFDSENPAEIKYNSAWLSKLTPEEFIRLTAMVTVQQMLERDMFKKRLQEDKPIYVHEFLYPLMQGYDSVAMEVDAEMGGTDQTFNMLIGRELMHELKNKDKFVITTELLINPKTGKKLMSKSEGGYVGLNDAADEMYGKIMALPDECIEPVYRLCTDIDLSTINFDFHPMQLKKDLALEITRMYHSAKEADMAQKRFEDTFQKGEINDAVEIRAETVEDLITNKIIESKSEWKRLVREGAVECDGKKITDPSTIKTGAYKIGKRRFVKIWKS